jgi:hypothetical protein
MIVVVTAELAAVAVAAAAIADNGNHQFLHQKKILGNIYISVYRNKYRSNTI